MRPGRIAVKSRHREHLPHLRETIDGIYEGQRLKILRCVLAR